MPIPSTMDRERGLVDPGDVVLIAFPFTDVGAVKRRPALGLMLSGTSFDEGLRKTLEWYRSIR